MADANKELLSFLKQFSPETEVRMFQNQSNDCLYAGKLEDIPFDLLRDKALVLTSIDDRYLTLNLRDIKRRK